MQFTYQIDDEISLRLVDTRHAEELYALIERNRAHLRPWFRWAPYVESAQEVREAIGNWLKMFAKTGFFTALVDVRGRPAGLVYALDPNIECKRVELGYWLASDATGRGVMSRAVTAVVDHAFAVMGMNRVTIKADVANGRSCALAERLGFEKEGVLRSWFVHRDGRVVDMAVYGQTRERWRDAGPGWCFTHAVDDGLALRLLEPRHAPELNRMIKRNHEHLRPWFSSAHRVETVDETSDKIAAYITGLARDGRVLTMIEADGHGVGLLYICDRSVENKRMEIGYWLDRAAQGNGYMARACRPLVRYGFECLGVNRIDITADVENRRSRGVAERLGFTHEADIARWVCMPDGRCRDMSNYRLLREDWKEVPQ